MIENFAATKRKPLFGVVAEAAPRAGSVIPVSVTAITLPEASVSVCAVPTGPFELSGVAAEAGVSVGDAAHSDGSAAQMAAAAEATDAGGVAVVAALVMAPQPASKAMLPTAEAVNASRRTGCITDFLP